MSAFQKHKMKIFTHIFIVLSTILASCSQSDQSDVIAFDSKVVPQDFPINEHLGEGRILDFNTLGNREILIFDSIAVVSTSANKKSWKILSLNSDSIIGEFVDAGNGPGELALVPLLSQASIINRGDVLLLAIPDNISSKWHNFNIKRIIYGQSDSDSISPDSELNQFTVYKGLKNNTIYRICINPTDKSIHRSISIDGETIITPYIEWLNHFTVDKLEDVGLLMPTVAISPSGNQVVEIYNSYPQINLYSLDRDSAITITPDGMAVGFEKFTNQTSDAVPIIYNGIHGYDKFFVINKTGENATSELCFYDWNGNPVLLLTIPHVVNSFDIDFNKGRILAINHSDDIIVEYKISDNIRGILK